MGGKYTLVTAVLMTMASLAWLASAMLVPHAEGASATRWLVVMMFAVLAAIYWLIYFNQKNSKISGTE